MTASPEPTPGLRERKNDLREYIRANLFDGDEGGDTTMRIRVLLDEVTDIVGDWLTERALAASPAPEPDEEPVGDDEDPKLGPNPCIICGEPAAAVVTVCSFHMVPALLAGPHPASAARLGEKP